MTHPLARVGGRARRSAYAVWLAGCGVYFLALLHRASLGVAGPQAMDRLDINAAQLGAFVMVQLGVYAAMQVPAGMLIDRLGPRRVLLVATLIMGTAQLTFAFATDYPLALAARALLGIGDSAVYISVLRLVAAWFPRRRYAVLTMASGLFGMAGNLAATIPLTLALGTFGWVKTFAVTGAVSLAYSLLLLRPAVAAPYREAPGPEVRPEDAVKGGWRHLVNEVRLTWRSAETRMGFWTHQATMSIGTVLAMVWGFPYLTEGLGYTDGEAAAQLSLLIFSTLVANFVVGPLAGRHPGWRMPMAVVISIVGVAALLTLVFWPGGEPPPLAVSVALVLISVGGPASQIGFHLARDYNPQRRISTATGLVNAGGFLGAMVGAILVGLVIDHRSGSNVATLTDYRWALGALAALGTLSIVAMLVSLLQVRKGVLGKIAAGDDVIVPVYAHWWDYAYSRDVRNQPAPRRDDEDGPDTDLGTDAGSDPENSQSP